MRQDGRCKHDLVKGECYLCNGNKPTPEYLRGDLLSAGTYADSYAVCSGKVLLPLFFDTNSEYLNWDLM